MALCDIHVAGCGEHLPAWGLRDDRIPGTDQAVRGRRHGQQLLSGSPPRKVDARGSADAYSSTDACLSQQKVQRREANRRRHRLTKPTTKALCHPPPPRAVFNDSAPLGVGLGGSHPTPPSLPIKYWATFSSRPSANQKFSLASISFDQQFSSAPLKDSAPLWGGGWTPHPQEKALPPPPPRDGGALTDGEPKLGFKNCYKSGYRRLERLYGNFWRVQTGWRAVGGREAVGRTDHRAKREGGNPPPPPVDTTKTRSDPQRVRMSSGERPIGAARGKKSDTEALCPPPPPAPGRWTT